MRGRRQRRQQERKRHAARLVGEQDVGVHAAAAVGSALGGLSLWRGTHTAAVVCGVTLVENHKTARLFSHLLVSFHPGHLTSIVYYGVDNDRFREIMFARSHGVGCPLWCHGPSAGFTMLATNGLLLQNRF